MKVTAECVPCLLRRVLFQSRLVGEDLEFQSMDAALKAFASGYRNGINSAKIATEVHRASYAILGKDPYLDLKIRADAVAFEYVGYAERFLDESDDRFRAAVMLAVIGNVMDFGVSIDSPEKFRDVFHDLISQGIGCDDIDEMRDILKKGDTVVYMFDNCGESQFDRFLIRELHSMGVRVVGVIRGEPILNDVSCGDLERIGLDKELDSILTTNRFAVGIDLDAVTDELKNEINGSAMIIAKGMANYESLSDQKLGIPVAHILRTKCAPVAHSLGVLQNINVVKLVRDS